MAEEARIDCPACGRDTAIQSRSLEGPFPQLYPHYDQAHWPWSYCPGTKVWEWTASEQPCYWTFRFFAEDGGNWNSWMLPLIALRIGRLEPAENLLEDWNRERRLSLREQGRL